MVAMSGGIDSSITALLLKEQGYELVGATLRIWDYLSEGCKKKETGCCSMESIFEARDFAKSLGIEHHIVDVRKSFKDSVVKNFIDEYLGGRTPNPCVMCNPLIKWGAILDLADQHDCYYIATGHYSQIATNDARHYVTKAADASKDQSYVLWQLTQKQIERTLLPLGQYKKSEIKEIATEKGFVKLSEKKESMEVCFIPDNDYRGFLRKQLPQLEEMVKGGNFVDAEGNILGSHDGYPFYTIGQRKGLKIALGHPAYVTSISKANNTITLGEKDNLLTSKMTVANYNGVKYETLPCDKELTVKIRYNSQPVACRVEKVTDGNTFHIAFNAPVSAVTAGQSAVFYEQNDVVGGAIIQ